VNGAAPPAVTLLPPETAIVFSMADAPDLFGRFMNTAFGQMVRDPQLRPLVEHVYKSAAEFVQDVEIPVGLSLAELAGIPQGETTVAVVTPHQAPQCFVVMLDAGTHTSDARRLLAKVTESLESSGARRSEEFIFGTRLVIYNGIGRRGRQMVFFEKSNAIVVASNLDTVKRMLAVWNGESLSTLAGNSTFNALVEHLRGVAGEDPQAVWYVNPGLLLERVGGSNPGAAMAGAMLPKLGLDGVLAVGGSLALDVGQFDLVFHTHVLLESPRRGVLEALALGSGNTKPENWVPAGVASYTTMHWRLDRAYESAKKMYDGYRGEGAWARLIDEQIGQIAALNFEEDMLPALDGRVTYAVWMERPVTPSSESSLIAFRLKKGASLDRAIDKVVAENGPFLKRRSVAGTSYLQFAPPESPQRPTESSPVGSCFGLLGDYLVITDRPSFYEEAIRTAADPLKSLAESPDFKRATDEIQRRSPSTPAMLNFKRPEEGLRVLYEEAATEEYREEIRDRGRHNPLFHWLEAALEANPLPPFAVMERYFAPKAAALSNEPNGIHYWGVTLRGQPD